VFGDFVDRLIVFLPALLQGTGGGGTDRDYYLMPNLAIKLRTIIIYIMGEKEMNR
jgi:hypothetical protein